jgi:hypothetical protein
MSDVKLIEANTLRVNSNQKRSINEFINEIVIGINKELKNARFNNVNYIITELPIVIGITNMANSDAQRVVYSKVIELLKNKGFNVKINHTPNVCRLKISWLTSEEEREVQRQLRIIQESTERF